MWGFVALNLLVGLMAQPIVTPSPMALRCLSEEDVKMQAVLLILTPLFPALCALLCWFVPALRPDKARDRFVLASLVASFLLTVALCLTGDGSLTLFTISQNLPVVAASDGLSRLFSILMSGMWLLSGAFSFGYMAHEGAQRAVLHLLPAHPERASGAVLRGYAGDDVPVL